MCVCSCHVQLFGTPWTVAARLLHPWDFPGRNTGAGCHFLLPGIVLTQGSNPHLLHHRREFFTTEPPKATEINNIEICDKEFTALGGRGEGHMKRLSQYRSVNADVKEGEARKGTPNHPSGFKKAPGWDCTELKVCL